MKDTILGEIYASLSRDELKKLNKYMGSSEWSISSTIVRCHECYYSHIKEKNDLYFDKQDLFKYIYPNEVYNDTKLRFTQNRLLKAIKQFVINLEYENDNIFTSKIWMDFLLEKKLKKNLQYHNRENKAISNSDYRYLNEYFKSQEESYISFQNPKEQEKQHQTIQNIINKARLFSDLVFIRNFCSLLTFSQTFKSIPVELPLDILNQIKNRTDINLYPEFRVYLSAIELLKEGTDETYNNYKKDLFETLDNWDDQEKINLFIYLLNFTSTEINKGNSRYIDEQFHIYEEFEEKGIFQIKNYITHGRINNVVIVYLRKNEFEKAENFVNKYIELLNEELKDSCRHFNLARIKFEKGQYKDSLRELLQVDFSKDAFYSINSKVLLLKTYFELKESDALDSLFTSFKEYIRKNKIITENLKTNYLGFVQTTKKLYEATNSQLISIKSIVENTPMIDKKWLLDKVEKRINDSKVKS
jgi:hypothetical protein